MTTIKQTIALDDSCVITTNDTTGFYDGTTNTTGFLIETNTDDPTFDVYKLSDGYFLNVLLYNKYACTPIVVNPSDTFYNIESSDVDNAVYANNFTPAKYTLLVDGSYTIKRLFIPSLAWYTANANNEMLIGKDVYYTDGTSIYKVTSGTPAIVTIMSVLNAALSNSTIVLSTTNFISTCYTNACYEKVLSTLLDVRLGMCIIPADVAQLIQTRDILYMTLEMIKYLKDENNISQIQKLIEAINICGTICSAVLGASSSSNCGCNG